MTEEKPQKASDLLAQQLKQATEAIIAAIKSSKTSTPSQHEHSIDEVADCPNCKPKLIAKFKPEIEKDLRPVILKEVKEKLKSKELVTCDGCGEIVEKESLECPNCKGKHAH